MSQEPRQVERQATLGKALPAGVVYHPNAFDVQQQRELLAAVSAIVTDAPAFQPVMPRTGKPFSVVMSNCGPLGWVSDRAGYRYQSEHPVTGRAWPSLPDILLNLWRAVAPGAASPEACLINFYGADAKMGSHQDRDEADTSCPVVSISLGDDAVFHIGGLTRAGPKARLTLRSGDVLVLGGPSRLAFHGIDRIKPNTSVLPIEGVRPGCRRINLTLRRVTAI